MSRPVISVRRIGANDQDTILRLWQARRAEAGLSARVRNLETSLLTALSRDDVTAYLAWIDSEPVGYVVVAEQSVSFSTDNPALAIEQLYVSPERRKTGVAHALLGAVCAQAEQAGVHDVIGHVPAQLKEANRFFARLGFTQAVVRRVVPTAVLRRRLTGDEENAQVASVARLLRRRRTARLRGAETPTA